LFEANIGYLRKVCCYIELFGSENSLEDLWIQSIVQHCSA